MVCLGEAVTGEAGIVVSSATGSGDGRNVRPLVRFGFGFCEDEARQGRVEPIPPPTIAGGDRQSVVRRRSSQLRRAATAALLIRASGTSRSKAWIPPGHTCSSALPPACQIRLA